MKQIILFLLLLANFAAKSQNPEQELTLRRAFNSIQTDKYLIALKSFRLEKLCADTILVVTLKNDKAKEKTVMKKSIDSHLYKNYFNKNLTLRLASETNNGRVMVFGFYNSEDIPEKFITLFLNYENDKIVVIEIQNNL